MDRVCKGTLSKRNGSHRLMRDYFKRYRQKNYLLSFAVLYLVASVMFAYYIGLSHKIFLLTCVLSLFLLALAFYSLHNERVTTSKLAHKNQGFIQKINTLHQVINRQEKEWVDLIDILSCTILTIDTKGNIVRVVNNLFPVAVDKGSTVYTLLGRENLPPLRKAVSEAFGSLQIQRFTIKMTISPSEVRWYDATVLPVIHFEDARTAQIIFNDATRHKVDQREKEKLIIELEKQKKELEQFSLSISHDLKSPLITINGFVGMLRKDILRRNFDQVEKDLFHISNATHRMQSLLDDLIKISQVGKLDYKYMRTPMADVAQDAIRLVHGRIQSKNVMVRVLPGMPVLCIDRRRIIEVYQNLIDNAIKYMGSQTAPYIEIGAKKKCGETVCYVKDNGMGIDYRHQERIFSLFDKLDSKSEGTGLGLAVVKRIIDKHNGIIWVESEGKGAGSTFCFIIPESEV